MRLVIDEAELRRVEQEYLAALGVLYGTESTGEQRRDAKKLVTVTHASMLKVVCRCVRIEP